MNYREVFKTIFLLFTLTFLLGCSSSGGEIESFSGNEQELLIIIGLLLFLILS